MVSRKPIVFVATLAACLAGGTLAFSQAPAPVPPPAPPMTLWRFLGIPQTASRIYDGAANRGGRTPGLERKPPVVGLAAPENLESPNPAIKKAAEIKHEEDLKQQKIKAVRYLASIGCGCYNKDGGITDALIAAMDDCTEEVRLATVKAIKNAAEGGCCENCNMKTCCSEEITKKLYELAYGRDDHGCFLEPSERVREAALEAMCTCCPGRGPVGMVYDMPINVQEFNGGGNGGGEVPNSGEVPGSSGMGTDELPPPPPGGDLETSDDLSYLYLPATIPTIGLNSVNAGGPRMQPVSIATSSFVPEPPIARPPLATSGRVVRVSADEQTVEVNLPTGEIVEVGDQATANRVFVLTGADVVAELEVLSTSPGAAVMKVTGVRGITKISAGDQVEFQR